MGNPLPLSGWAGIDVTPPLRRTRGAWQVQMGAGGWVRRAGPVRWVGKHPLCACVLDDLAEGRVAGLLLRWSRRPARLGSREVLLE